MKKHLLTALLLFTSSAQVHAIENTVWRMEINAKDDGVWVGGKYYSKHFLCREDVIEALNETVCEIYRFLCAYFCGWLVVRSSASAFQASYSSILITVPPLS